MTDKAAPTLASSLASSAIISVAPVTLPAPDRGTDLKMRVTAPVRGEKLPIIIFSHGFTQSYHAYSPLVNYWAAHGFVVIQPAHLDSWTLALPQDDPRMPQLWCSREQDLKRILDEIDRIDALTPVIQGRLDRDRIAVAGHSWGATTASGLLGVTHPDPDNGTTVDCTDARVKAGVLLCVAGTGGDNLSPLGAAHFPFMHPDFTGMRRTALIVAGDKDQSPLSVCGPDWWRQAYDLSPEPKALFTLFGGEHSLGGIHSYEFDQGDASRERVAAIQRLSTAYLLGALDLQDGAWEAAVALEGSNDNPLGKVETK